MLVCLYHCNGIQDIRLVCDVSYRNFNYTKFFTQLSNVIIHILNIRTHIYTTSNMNYMRHEPNNLQGILCYDCTKLF